MVGGRGQPRLRRETNDAARRPTRRACGTTHRALWHLPRVHRATARRGLLSTNQGANVGLVL